VIACDDIGPTVYRWVERLRLELKKKEIIEMGNISLASRKDFSVAPPI